MLQARERVPTDPVRARQGCLLSSSSARLRRRAPPGGFGPRSLGSECNYSRTRMAGSGGGPSTSDRCSPGPVWSDTGPTRMGAAAAATAGLSALGAGWRGRGGSSGRGAPGGRAGGGGDGDADRPARSGKSWGQWSVSQSGSESFNSETRC